MARLISPGDVVGYSDRAGQLRNAIVARVYPQNGTPPLVDLIYVVPPASPALYPVTKRRSLVRPQDQARNGDEFYAPASVSI